MGKPTEDAPEDQSVTLDFGAPKASGRGRPTIGDDELIEIRNGLLWLLSVKWADIGWRLPRATTLEELRRALEPLRGHTYEYLVTPFLHPTPVTASAEEIRSFRKNRGEAIESARAAQSDYDRCFTDARKAELAMNETEPGTQQPFFSNMMQQWRERKQAQMKLDAAQAVLKTMERDVADKEAGFCQSELVDFITKAKYARDPSGLANAMAGLPDIAWETSWERCSKVKVEPNFHYAVFVTISTIWNQRERYSESSSVQLFRQEILKLPKRRLVRVSGLLAKEKGTDKIKLPNNIRSYLVENWPYLKTAIEQVEGVRSHPHQVPFLILAAFQRNLEKPRTPQDLVRADMDKIE
jgi:hypothetical protein